MLLVEEEEEEEEEVRTAEKVMLAPDAETEAVQEMKKED